MLTMDDIFRRKHQKELQLELKSSIESLNSIEFEHRKFELDRTQT